jgi:hypothetical protein
MGIHKDLSDLVYYVQSISFHSFEDSRTKPFYTMSSLAEKKALGFANDGAPNGAAVVCFFLFFFFVIFKFMLPIPVHLICITPTEYSFELDSICLCIRSVTLDLFMPQHAGVQPLQHCSSVSYLP